VIYRFEARPAATRAPSARLTLSRTRIPGAGEDDWSVIVDGKEIIGRIYKSPKPAGDPWFWGLNRFPSSAANSAMRPI
jgi:hypothetical protein